MSLVVGKVLSLFSISASLVASVLWSPVLLANDNTRHNINVTKSVLAGVEQTDPLTILKLPDIEFEHPLSVVSIPVTVVSPSYSADNLPAVIIPSSKPAVKMGQNSELLTMNAELANEHVSAELLAKFNRALTATSDSDSIPVKVIAESHNAVPITDLPAHLRAQIPDISYSSHVYSSTPKNRSVRLNNRDLREGSWLSENVEILEILQNEVIMRVGAQSFSLQALSDWSA
ncbi:General secretion pathway protein B [Moritella sp. JT01]|uniref:general secretion pathway protein GspB n=1 Tax=Moritella sp. JT01 TaxID=756698 RepID=UPI00079A6A38|nr:general secretion pathway protein GspB [Moritella sp. JT01]KXO13509.1 General secretion pathway protein B [Moritella sp. JT01]